MPAIRTPPSSSHLQRPSHNSFSTILIVRSLTTTSISRSRDTHYHRSDFRSQSAGYSSSYDPDAPTKGPLSQASKHGAPRLTPSLLKAHLDKFIVGQDKAKKVTCVAIFNHYQRIREIRRQEEEEIERREKEARWEMRERERERERNSHPVENEFPGHVESVDLNTLSSQNSSYSQEPDPGSLPISEPPLYTIIEKSNLLLLGPSGVGKTYILQTLSSMLSVPFATVDCSSLTQAGYIGSDIESSIERLLLASNHSIRACETGIIFFDEVDKLAKPAVMTHGRDVSGEGVQQGLLKMIEGTTVTVNTKSDRSSKSEGRGDGRLERGRDGASGGGAQGKSEQYTIDTKNILFVFAGAFVGLEKIISSRLRSGSGMGFGAQLRSPSSNHATQTQNQPSATTTSTLTDPLANLQTSDLQSYGLIPELLGRIPILTSLTPLSLSNLVSILTEPRNSLVKQYTALFQTFGVQLRFSTGSLWAVAERALGKVTSPTETGSKNGSILGGGVGARGLRSIIETVLGEIMYWAPGSAIRFCLVDEKFVREQVFPSSPSTSTSLSSPTSTSIPSPSPSTQPFRPWTPISEHQHHHTQFSLHSSPLQFEDPQTTPYAMPRCWARGQSRVFEEAFSKEEDAWRSRDRDGEGKEVEEDGMDGKDGKEKGAFETFRRVGSSGM